MVDTILGWVTAGVGLVSAAILLVLRYRKFKPITLKSNCTGNISNDEFQTIQIRNRTKEGIQIIDAEVELLGLSTSKGLHYLSEDADWENLSTLPLLKGVIVPGNSEICAAFWEDFSIAEQKGGTVAFTADDKQVFEPGDRKPDGKRRVRIQTTKGNVSLDFECPADIKVEPDEEFISRSMDY